MPRGDQGRVSGDNNHPAPASSAALPPAGAGTPPTLLARLAGSPLLPLATLSLVGFPAGSARANWFSFFNAVSWQIALGAPVILYAQKLGANDALLGLLAALQPLLATLQVPGAHLLPRFGYRRVMVWGWAARTVMLFVLASAPLWLASHGARLGAILMCLAAFNLFRGLTGGAWMPWITELIPQTVRGRFFSQQQIFGMVGSLLALGMVSLLLAGRPGAGQFSLAILLSAIGGAISVFFLAGTPDISTPQARRRAGARVPWLAMIRFKPFQRLSIFNILFALLLGGLGVFTVAFLRGVAGFSESAVVLLSAMSVIGGLLSLLWSGPLLDHISARAIIRLGVLVMGLICAGWWILATRAVGHPLVLVGALYLLSGIAGIHITVANLRLQTMVIPIMGRNHFFALFTVVTALAGAASPLAWGLLLSALGSIHQQTGGFVWNRYCICFAGAALLCLPLLWYCRRLIETAQPGTLITGTTGGDAARPTK